MLNVARSKVDLVRSVLISALALAAAAFFLNFVNEFYPLKEWLFFRYARTWIFASIFAFSSLACGWKLLRSLQPRSMALAERLTLSFALGVLAFFGGVFFAGCFNLYGIVFFVGWPLLLAIYGGPSLVADLLPSTHGHGVGGWHELLPRTVPQLVAASFLALGVLAVYLQVIVPMNLGADSYSYHLPIAESYVAAGGIRRFNEGWYVGTYPQLASFLYTWAFQAPGEFIDHVLLCTHIEFVLFVATLVSVAVFSAKLLHRERLPYAAAALFLFPKLFIYDSNLNCGADHVIAFFCIALAIALLRLYKHFDNREACFAGLMMGALILTKYQAVYVFVPTGLLCLIFMLRFKRIQPGVTWGLVTLACSAPHWLKNWLFYHDPMYPFLHAYLHSTPFHKGADRLLNDIFWTRQFSPAGTTAHKLEATLKALGTFSFVPNDWGFHGKRPEFGSLFTLLLPILLLFRKTGRIWVTVVAVHIGIAIWYYINHQDRYLQLLVPCMAAVVAAILALAWEQGTVSKSALVVLVGAQVVWGADAYFIPGHVMLGDAPPISALIPYVQAGYRGNYERRFDLGASIQAFGKHLPPGAKLLQHEYDTHLGLGAQFVMDRVGWQGAIEYLQLTTPQQTAALMRRIGVTHVTWGNNRMGMSPSEVARELVFSRFFYEYVPVSDPIYDWKLGPFADSPRSQVATESPTRIAWLTCNSSPANGIYTPQGLADSQPERVFSENFSEAELNDAFAAINAAAIRSGCKRAGIADTVVSRSFTKIQKAGEFDLWVRSSWGDFRR